MLVALFLIIRAVVAKVVVVVVVLAVSYVPLLRTAENYEAHRIHAGETLLVTAVFSNSNASLPV